MGERLSNEGGNDPVEGGVQPRKPPPGGHNGGRNRDLAVNDEAAIVIDHNGASDKEGEASLPEVVALTKKGSNKKLKKKQRKIEKKAELKYEQDAAEMRYQRKIAQLTFWGNIDLDVACPGCCKVYDVDAPLRRMKRMKCGVHHLCVECCGQYQVTRDKELEVAMRYADKASRHTARRRLDMCHSCNEYGTGPSNMGPDLLMTKLMETLAKQHQAIRELIPVKSKATLGRQLRKRRTQRRREEEAST